MVKINTLEVENVKRIKALKLSPSESGLTVIGGRNGQGKTSVLDAIAWGLGGDKFKPSAPKREGSFADPELHITLSNGLVVERKGKNGSLKVTDPNGNKGGQTLLNEFVETLALDLPRFLKASSKEKAETLLKIIGVGDMLKELDLREKTLYDERHSIGIIADRKAKFAKEMPTYSGVPDAPVSPMELIKKQQEILARNGENQRKRMLRDKYEKEYEDAKNACVLAKMRLKEAEENVIAARSNAADTIDESTKELENSIADVENLNAKIRANFEREKAEAEAESYRTQYESLTDDIEEVRAARRSLLENADLPLKGLSVEDGELTYKGQKWDCMSGSEQLIVGAAIVRRLNPDCGFVLLDKLEQLDADTLKTFGEWLESEGLQAIATRVSTGGECSIIIEDGRSAAEEKPAIRPEWKEGVF